MNTKPRLLCLLMQLPIAGQILAQSTFGGAFLVGTNNHGFTPGKISISLTNGQPFFQVTLFSNWVSDAPLQASLKTHQKEIAFDLGTGTPGRWPFQEFIGPLPGTQPQQPKTPPSNLETFPSPPMLQDGVRFTGTFEAEPSLEHMLRSQGGTVRIQLHGTVTVDNSSLQDPLITATLIELTQEAESPGRKPSDRGRS